jgi:hypothetical protein
MLRAYFASQVLFCDTVTIFISFRFVESLNEILSTVTFLKILTFPILLCMNRFQMMQVNLCTILHKIITLVCAYLFIHNKHIAERP